MPCSFVFNARTKTVFFANICACPVKCEAYFSGVRLKFQSRHTTNITVVKIFIFLDLNKKL